MKANNQNIKPLTLTVGVVKYKQLIFLTKQIEALSPNNCISNLLRYLGYF